MCARHTHTHAHNSHNLKKEREREKYAPSTNAIFRYASDIKYFHIPRRKVHRTPLNWFIFLLFAPCSLASRTHSVKVHYTHTLAHKPNVSKEQPAATKRKIIFFLLEDRWLLVIRWCKMGTNQLDAKNKLPKITPFAKAHTFPHLATRTRTFSARRKPWILKIKRDSHKHTDFFVLSRVACTARERRMSNVCAIMIRPYDCPLEIWHWTAMHLSTLNTQTTRFEQKKPLRSMLFSGRTPLTVIMYFGWTQERARTTAACWWLMRRWDTSTAQRVNRGNGTHSQPSEPREPDSESVCATREHEVFTETAIPICL